MAVPIANQRDLHRFSNLSPCHSRTHAIALGVIKTDLARRAHYDYVPPRPRRLDAMRHGRHFVSHIRIMGRSQAVRQRILIPSCEGSIPSAPAKYFNDLAWNK